ncbi:MAG: hypothetical protein AB7P14_06160 [Blastocatellales bacterium]
MLDGIAFIRHIIRFNLPQTKQCSDIFERKWLEKSATDWLNTSVQLHIQPSMTDDNCRTHLETPLPADALKGRQIGT